MNDLNLDNIIEGCRRNQRASQQRLHAQFYHYAMHLARMYAGTLESAEEIVNDAFFKVFTKLEQYSGQQAFRPWLRRIVINTAIDRYRSELNTPPIEEWQPWHDSDTDPGILESLAFEQILELLDLLPPAYRTVFNLFVVEGYSHEEVATELGISIGASKSNLSRARQHLKHLLVHEFEFIPR